MAAASETPARMRAVTFNEYGAPADVLNMTEVDVPEPGENEVLVKVEATGINPFDWKIISGYVQQMMTSLIYEEDEIPRRVKNKLNRRGHTSGEGLTNMKRGTVAKVGPGVSTFAVGDAVMGSVNPGGQGGTFAEYVCSPVATTLPRPDNVSVVQGGGFGCICGTSHQALTLYSTIVPGESRVLVLGGSSSTGMMGIQYAKALGAAFVATTSTQEELCRTMGADVVVNYREADYVEVLAEEKFDIVYDCVGQEGSLEKAQAVTKPGSVFVSIALQPKTKPEYPEFKFFVWNEQGMDQILPLLADGRVQIPVDERSPYTFENFGTMIADSMAGRARGKLVMTIP